MRRRGSRNVATRLDRQSALGQVVVLKLGGELLEESRLLRRIARTVSTVATGLPLVVVHGGGREIDAALARAGIMATRVDGVRVTDDATLTVVVSVLAGTINTRLVAAVNHAGGTAVGLTGADAGVGEVKRAPRHRSTTGRVVDLGLVGQPVRRGPSALVQTLVAARFVPVIASIGLSRQGVLYNVNADTMAANVAAGLGAARLVMAGTTAGVLDEQGRTARCLDAIEVTHAVNAGIASAGMVAKLMASQDALAGGVREVVIADGRRTTALAAALRGQPASGHAWTRLVARSEHPRVTGARRKRVAHCSR